MSLKSILEINKKHHQNMVKDINTIDELYSNLHIRIYNITKDNKFFILDNNLDHLENYINKKCYKIDPHLIPCELVTEDYFILWPNKLDNEHNGKWFTMIRELHNLGDGLTIIKINNNGYLSFSLCANKTHENGHRLYYNYHDSIQHFVKLLGIAIEHILLENIDSYMSLNKIINCKSVKNSIIQNVLSANERNAFLHML